MPTAVTPAPKRADNPYVGPRPFTDSERIYGRDDDCESILRLLTSERILLLHSPSGAGKSSLINAALLPRLRKRFSPQPTLAIGVPESAAGAVSASAQFRAYLSHFSDLSERDPKRILVAHLLSGWNENLAEEERLPAAELARCTIGDFARKWLETKGQPRFPVFVFDQFEDVFTRFSDQPEGIEEFFRQLGDLFKDPGIWALIAMREDYLGNLEPYCKYIPDGLRARCRLELLVPEQAVEAVRLPSVELCKVEFDKGLATELVTRLRKIIPEPGMPPRTGRFVEPVLLQVVCRAMWDRLLEGADKIPAGIIPNEEQIKDAIGDFYEEVIARVAQKNGIEQDPLRAWCETELIQGRARAQVRRGPMKTLQDVDILKGLEEEHLIRRDGRGETTWHELVHDRLVEAILENNLRWKLQLPEDKRLLLTAAQRWQESAESNYFLLRGRALQDAEKWASANASRVTQVERIFLERSKRERRVTFWLRVLVVSSILCILVAAGTIRWAGNSVAESKKRTLAANEDISRATQATSQARLDKQNAEKALAAESANRQKTVSELENARAGAEQAEARAARNAAGVKRIEREFQSYSLATQNELLQKSAELGQLGNKLADRDNKLKEGQKNLDDQTKIADDKRAAADRLSARAQSRVQAADAVAHMGENTRADVQKLIVALKEQLEKHRTIEPDALSVVPVLLPASLNRRTLVHRAPVSGVGTGPIGEKLLAVTNSGAVRFRMGTGEIEEKAFRLCLDRGGIRFTVSTPPQNARQGCTTLAWPSAIAAGGGANEVLVGFPNGRIFLWDWDAAKSTPIPGHRHPIVKLDFSDDARSAVSASAFWSFGVASLEDPPRLRYRRPNVIEWARIAVGGGGTELVRSVRFLGATDLLGVGFEDGRVELWSASRGKRWASKRLHWDAVLSLTCDDSGAHLVSTGRDGTAFAWRVQHEAGKDPQLVMVHELRPQTGTRTEVMASAFDPSGSTVALGLGDGWVELWDAEKGEQLLRIKAHTGRVNAVRFLARDLLVSAGDDGLVRTWRVLPASEMAQMMSLIHAIETAGVPREDDTQLLDAQIERWKRVLEDSEAFLRKL